MAARTYSEPQALDANGRANSAFGEVEPEWSRANRFAKAEWHSRPRLARDLIVVRNYFGKLPGSCRHRLRLHNLLFETGLRQGQRSETDCYQVYCAQAFHPHLRIPCSMPLAPQNSVPRAVQNSFIE